MKDRVKELPEFTRIGTCACGERIVRREYGHPAPRTTWQHGEGEAVFTMTLAELVSCWIFPSGVPQPLAAWLMRLHQYERREAPDPAGLFAGPAIPGGRG
jgi:hypothetical protein